MSLLPSVSTHSNSAALCFFPAKPFVPGHRGSAPRARSRHPRARPSAVDVPGPVPLRGRAGRLCPPVRAAGPLSATLAIVASASPLSFSFQVAFAVG